MVHQYARKAIYIVLAAALAVTALSGCEERNLSPERIPGTDIQFGLSTAPAESATKTAFSNERTTQTSGGVTATLERIDWIPGDEVRIYCAQATGVANGYADYAIGTVTRDGYRSISSATPVNSSAQLKWGNLAAVHKFYALYPSPASQSSLLPGGTTIGAPTTNPDGSSLLLSLPGTQNGTDMRLAYMVAGATHVAGAGAGNVPLTFEPAVTAVRVVLTPGSSYSYAGAKMMLRKVTLSSVSSSLYGDYTANIGTNGAVTYAWVNQAGKSVTVDCGGREFTYGQRDTLHFFIPPFPVSDAVLTIETENGEITTDLSGSTLSPNKLADLIPESIPNAVVDESMSFVIKTTASERTFRLPFRNDVDLPTNLIIFWGDADNTKSRLEAGVRFTNATKTFTYKADDVGEHTITIVASAPETYMADPANPRIPQFNFNNTTDTQRPMVTRIITPVLRFVGSGTSASTQSTFGRYMFQDLTNLTEVCGKVFSKNPQLIDMRNLFENCTSLRSIPADLFEGLPNAENFYRAFALSGLRSLPSGIFSSLKNATTFQTCFYQCAELTTIPAGLFKGLDKVQNFWSTFNQSGLTNLPSDTFAGCTDARTFRETFNECHYLVGPIPPGLFAGLTKVTNFHRTFRNCYLLEGSIPEGLFDDCTLAGTFGDGQWDGSIHGLFQHCHNLAGPIPEGLFDSMKENITTCAQTFGNCYSLQGNIPAGLFKDMSQSKSFLGIFHRCESLTGSIPADLFKGCVSDTTFQEAFDQCYNLISDPSDPNGYFVPEDLFRDCPNVVSFELAFYDCRGLTGKIPEKLLQNKPSLRTISKMCYAMGNGFARDAFHCGLNGYSDGVLIPKGLFQDAPKLKDVSRAFQMAFDKDKPGGYLPAELFSNNKSLEDASYFVGFNQTVTADPDPNYPGFIVSPTFFSQNSNLKSLAYFFEYNRGLIGKIPPGLFDGLTVLENVKVMFSRTGITEIPADLFKDCGESMRNMQGAFHETKITNIPEGLFDPLVNVEDLGSDRWSTQGLGLDDDSFPYRGVFARCFELTDVPAGLFAKNSKVSNFRGLFAGCRKLKVNENIFIDPANQITAENRFSSLTTPPDFSYAFDGVGSAITDAGMAPDLWNYNFGFLTPIFEKCFMSTWNKYTNAASIPASWK